MQQITVEMIETKEFQIKPRGYDQQEVDGFLDDICDEMERMQNEMNELRQQLADARAAAARPAPAVAEEPTRAVPVVKPAAGPATAISEEFQEILLMAQKVKSETIAEAERKAAEITAEAQKAADAKLQDLSGQRESLLKEIASLKESGKEYRARFEALLGAQKDALEKAKELF